MATSPQSNNGVTSAQGNNILIQLAMEKIKNFYGTNLGFWFDKIVEALSVANVSAAQMYEIIYQAIPEVGQREIKFENEENKNLPTLKIKLKNIFGTNTSIRAKTYISNCYLVNFYFAVSCIHDITLFVRRFYNKIYLENVSDVYLQKLGQNCTVQKMSHYPSNKYIFLIILLEVKRHRCTWKNWQMR